MSKTRLILYSLLVSTFIWMLFSWPQLRYLNSGIPASSTNIETGQARFMVNGDQLQLHYFYWLFSDMVKGNTPWFHNLYEFNTGDDAARYNVGNYNIPFSLIYVFWDIFGNAAFAWNMLGLTTLWLTYLATWLLLRRFTNNRIAALLAIAGITLPYRYITMFGGSPMGYAMLWPPLIILGLDMAVRDLSFKGGILAGLALLCAYYNDTRVFLFSVMSAPLWCFFGLLRRENRSWINPKFWGGVTLRLLPVAIVVLNQIIAGYKVKAQHFSQTVLGAGREISEVAQFSPDPIGLVKWFELGKNAHAFIGFVLPLLCITGMLWAIWNSFRKRHFENWRDDLILLLLLGLGTGLALLALGPNGPFNGLFYMKARRILPAYEFMRMTAQAFCLMPTVLALCAAIAIKRLTENLPSAHLKTILIITLTLLFTTEYAMQVRATICRLPSEQQSYAAVAEDAATAGHAPRAMAIPIWPGDSAWSAIYQYYATLYHIRMLNGYSPQVKNEYIDTIFKRLGRSNIAVLPDKNLNFLLERKIDCLILHEDAFPEKVSPFPVCFTLKRLLNHSRLKLIGHDGSVWAFKILRTPVQHAKIKPGWNLFFPTLHWELEYTENTNARGLYEDGVSGGHFLSVEQGGTVKTRPFKPWNAPNAKLMLRARGRGRIAILDKTINIDTYEWCWFDIPVSPGNVNALCEPVLTVIDGHADLDTMFYMSGDWTELASGETLNLKAALFFHAGCINMQTDGVRLRKDYEPDGSIFYGPNLPLSAGRYRVELHFTTEAAPGTHLGKLRVRRPGGDYDEVPVAAKESATITITRHSNLPIRIEFAFSRNADMEIQVVTIKRLP